MVRVWWGCAGIAMMVAVCAAVTDLSGYSAEELAGLEGQLIKTVQELETRTAETRKEIDGMSVEMAGLDEELGSRKKLEDEYSRQKRSLADMQALVRTKSEQTETQNKEVAQLRTEVNGLQAQLDQLQTHKQRAEQLYLTPSISNVLDKRAEGWSLVSRSLYKKAKKNLFPSVQSISSDVHSFEENMRRKSRILGLLTALILYGSTVGFMLVGLHVYARLRGQLTVSKMIFLGDSFCSCFWMMTLLCYVFLLSDPLYVIKMRSQALFFISQVLAATAYTFYALLRVAILAEKLSLAPFGELSAVIIVGHHFYLRIWQPALTDYEFHGSFFVYLCYAAVFSVLANRGIQAFVPLRQLHGPKLGFFTSLRVAFRRLTSTKVPAGDLLPRSSRSQRMIVTTDDSSSYDSDSDRDD